MMLVPVKKAHADAFINSRHRHHRATVGWLWGHGLADDDGNLCGVAVVGRPVSRHLDDGRTCEVTRLCTDGSRNACSMLYSAARRAAIAMGYNRGITYILESENGASLKASGWRFLYASKGGCWDRKKRPRDDDSFPLVPKQAWGWGDWENG